MSDLIEKYEKLQDEETRLQAALAKVKAEKVDLVQQIFDQLGKGPHVIHGQLMIPINKTGSWFMKTAPARKKVETEAVK
jgi:hypothetical protein